MTHPLRYRERLWPAAWIFVSTALVIPASFLVFLPISPTAGVVIAIVLYGAVVVALVLTTPTIAIDEEHLHAGPAHLPLSLISRASAAYADEAVAERGIRLDARAWLLLRGWIPALVRIELDDPRDPTPYWLVSTRHPDELVATLSAAQAPTR